MKLADLPNHLLIIARAMFNTTPDPADNPRYMRKNKKKTQAGNSFVKIAGETYALSNRRDDPILGEGAYAKTKIGINVEGKKFTFKIAKIKSDITSNEATIGAVLERTYGVGERTVEGVLKRYIVQEYIEGEELFNLVSQGPILDVYTRLSIFYGIALDLKKIHDKRVIHGDLNSANVIVDLRSLPISAKIIDFGLSKLLSDESHVAYARGLCSEPYKAPELNVEGDYATFSVFSDIYALGIIGKLDLQILECLELERSLLAVHPWDRPSLEDIIQACEMSLSKFKSCLLEDFEEHSISSPTLLVSYGSSSQSPIISSSSTTSEQAPCPSMSYR